MMRIMLATWLFGAVHSALASSEVKRAAARTFGPRNRNGLYRVFYIVQSLLTFAVLARYIIRQPSRQIYHIRGPLAWLMHVGQGMAAAMTMMAAWQVGIPRILGLTSLRYWLGGGAVPREPAAQGPALDREGLSKPAGPFAASRHPLNFVPVAILWLWPRMTTSLLAFNAAATAYLVVGSRHEEKRLLEAYGDRYRAYQQSGVPFYWPRPRRSWSESTKKLIQPGETAAARYETVLPGIKE